LCNPCAHSAGPGYGYGLYVLELFHDKTIVISYFSLTLSIKVSGVSNSPPRLWRGGRKAGVVSLLTLVAFRFTVIFLPNHSALYFIVLVYFRRPSRPSCSLRLFKVTFNIFQYTFYVIINQFIFISKGSDSIFFQNYIPVIIMPVSMDCEMTLTIQFYG